MKPPSEVYVLVGEHGPSYVIDKPSPALLATYPGRWVRYVLADAKRKAKRKRSK